MPIAPKPPSRLVSLTKDPKTGVRAAIPTPAQPALDFSLSSDEKYVPPWLRAAKERSPTIDQSVKAVKSHDKDSWTTVTHHHHAAPKANFQSSAEIDEIDVMEGLGKSLARLDATAERGTPPAEFTKVRGVGGYRWFDLEGQDSPTIVVPGE